MSTSSRATLAGRLELAALLRTAAETGAADIALGISPFDPPPAVLQGAAAALAEGGQHQYADPAGLLALRVSIADEMHDFYGVSVDPHTEVTVTCGATEGVFVALLAVTDPGDEVLVFEPFFETYPGMVVFAGAVPKLVPLQRPGWRLDARAVRNAISPRTRAVVVNTPHNPTGRVFDTDEISRLIELCAQHDLTCIVDEVYADYVFDGRTHLTPLALPGSRERVVSVGSFSKKLHVAGWRVGFCVANAETTAAIRAAHARTTVGTSHPLQAALAARTSFGAGPEVALIQQQRDLMTERLSALGLRADRAEGGWYLLADVSEIGWRAGDLARQLVEEAGVLVAPGTSFFAGAEQGANWVRVTFVRDAATTKLALDRLEEFLPARRPIDV